ncbi:MAG TPA: LptA/OstA family protein [Desulfosalsimonadaceae bacterium]|nr:LptA/OstA family protein [Desulfosalsimonadaceae bacterium]
MRQKIFNPIIFQVFIFFIAICLASAAGLMPAYAETSPGKKTSPGDNNKLHIRADRLVSQRESNYIQFMGNVEVDVANTKIASSKLRVFYAKRASAESSLTREDIKKVVASGGVRIIMEDRIAHCEQAVYHPRKQTLVLTGKSVEIKSENNVVTGSQITFNQKTGEIIVDGAPEQRVNAIIHRIEEDTETEN